MFFDNIAVLRAKLLCIYFVDNYQLSARQNLFHSCAAASISHCSLGQFRLLSSPCSKKPSLDAADVKNYRPISNLKVTSKLLEKLVDRQLIKYLSDYRTMVCYHTFQSAYRATHSTETAIARVLSDLLSAVDWRYRSAGHARLIGSIDTFMSSCGLNYQRDLWHLWNCP